MIIWNYVRLFDLHVRIIGGACVGGALLWGFTSSPKVSSDPVFLGDRPSSPPVSSPQIVKRLDVDPQLITCLYKAGKDAPQGFRIDADSLKTVLSASDLSWMNLAGKWQSGDAMAFTVRYFTRRTDGPEKADVMRLTRPDGAGIYFGFSGRYFNVRLDSGSDNRPPVERDIDLTADDLSNQISGTDSNLRPDKLDISRLVGSVLPCLKPLAATP